MSLVLHESVQKERKSPQSEKSIGRTLTAVRSVAARWFIFKQVLKVQILIRAADATQLFLQICLVAKRGHRSSFGPQESRSSEKAKETRVFWREPAPSVRRCRAARGETHQVPGSSARRGYFQIEAGLLFSPLFFFFYGRRRTPPPQPRLVAPLFFDDASKTILGKSKSVGRLEQIIGGVSWHCSALCCPRVFDTTQ